MHSSNLPNQQIHPDKILFDEICTSAIKRDKKTLQTLVEKGIFLNFTLCIPNEEPTKHDHPYTIPITVLSWLAEQGQDEAVDFLIDQFNLNRDEALRGYAKALRKEKVEEHIRNGAKENFAWRGYAAGGHFELLPACKDCGDDKHMLIVWAILNGHEEHNWLKDPTLSDEFIKKGYLHAYAMVNNTKKLNELKQQVNDLSYEIRGAAYGKHVEAVDQGIASGANISQVLFSYANAGHVKEINKLLEERPYLVREAILYYARTGNVTEVNKHIAQCADMNKVNYCDQAKKGYQYYVGSEINANPLSRLMKVITYTNDKLLRTMLIDYAHELAPSDNIEKQLRRLTEIIHHYDLSYRQAQALARMGENARMWFMLATELVKDTSKECYHPVEIYFHVCAVLVDLTPYDARMIFKAIHNRHRLQVLDMFSQSPNTLFARSLNKEQVLELCDNRRRLSI